MEHDPSPISSAQALNSRRHFLKTTLTAGAFLSAGGLTALAKKAPRPKAPSRRDRKGIEHVVVVMMENRSFDHFLGWVPGSDGRQAGLQYPDRSGVARPTYPLAPDYQGCGHPDPDHSYEGGRIEYNKGACDGWLRAGANDQYAIGYYQKNDLPFYAGAASAWTVCDRYFSALMAGTFPNRIYQHAAQTDRLHNTFEISRLPTIWDRLAEKGLTGRYYFSDLPFIALWGAKYLPISRPISQFYADCASGNLPEVSFVEPRMIGEAEGISTDDHPHADVRNGQTFLNRVYEAVTSSPNWPNTVMVINYDEWGGFYDHVAPPTAPIPEADKALGSDGLLGFRVPAMVISPWAKRGRVVSDTFDHTSVLKMIEWRWGLRPLTVRDRAATNLANALDFSRTNLEAPRFPVPAGPFGGPCALQEISDEVTGLALLATSVGFRIP